MTFYDIIYKWVADNFGTQEAEDPESLDYYIKKELEK